MNATCVEILPADVEGVMASMTFKETEAARAARGQRSIASIIADRMQASVENEKRNKKIISLQNKLKKKLAGDDFRNVYLPLEKLGTARQVELEEAAWEVGYAMGVAIGYQPALDETLEPLVEDLSALLAQHDEANGVLGLARVLYAVLLAQSKGE